MVSDISLSRGNALSSLNLSCLIKLLLFFHTSSKNFRLDGSKLGTLILGMARILLLGEIVVLFRFKIFVLYLSMIKSISKLTLYV
jgi:hypothetical protein